MPLLSTSDLLHQHASSRNMLEALDRKSEGNSPRNPRRPWSELRHLVLHTRPPQALFICGVLSSWYIISRVTTFVLFCMSTWLRFSIETLMRVSKASG